MHFCQGVLLAAVPGHLFDLAEGSIPSATTGIERLLHREESIFFQVQERSSANCSRIFGVAPMHFFLPAETHAPKFFPPNGRALFVRLWPPYSIWSALWCSILLFYHFRFGLQAFRASSSYCFRFGQQNFAEIVSARSSYCFGFGLQEFSRARRIVLASGYCFIVFASSCKHCLQARRTVFASDRRNCSHALVVLLWLRAAGIFTRSSYCFGFEPQDFHALVVLF